MPTSSSRSARPKKGAKNQGLISAGREARPPGDGKADAAGMTEAEVQAGEKVLAAAEPEAGRLEEKSGKRPKKKKKKPVPKDAVWWVRAEGHPMLKFFGAEVKWQREEVNGWTLEDLHQASGLSRSFLSDLENGKCQPTEEVVLELEAAFCLKPGALMHLTRQRWKRELKKPGMMEALITKMKQVQRAWRRDALAAWLGGLLPFKIGLAWEEALA